MKASSYREVRKFQDIPNVGPAIERNFILLGLTTPSDLIDQDPYEMYQRLCHITGSRQDPCVLDTYIAVVDFMNGAPSRPWYYYTEGRKKKYKGL